jgi:hypothetical protein
VVQGPLGCGQTGGAGAALRYRLKRRQEEVFCRVGCLVARHVAGDRCAERERCRCG